MRECYLLIMRPFRLLSYLFPRIASEKTYIKWAGLSAEQYAEEIQINKH